MSWWDREINIWRVVGYQRQNQLFDRSHDSRRFTLVAKVLLKVRHERFPGPLWL